MTKLFDHLVLDSAPLLNNSLPESLSKNFYTIPEVLEEIRDEASRARLSQLPFKLVTRSPSPQAMAMTSRFARATGDLSVLSATDLKVIALTVTLELENNGNNGKMRRDPSEIPQEKTHDGAKEYFESLKSSKKQNNSKTSADLKKETEKKKKNRKGGVEVDSFDEISSDFPAKTEMELSVVQEDDGNDSDGEWITPENFEAFKSSLNSGIGKSEWTSEGVKPVKESVVSAKSMKSAKPTNITPVSTTSRVACITSDFAMQNVLLQMRLELYTPDGCRVKNVKNWLLRCHACYTTTRNMEARFCPKCGGPTLMRTSFMIDESGACHLFLRSDFQYNLRGTKYAVPKFKGGRQGASIILREDQKEFQRQKEHYQRVQGKILKNQEESGTLEAIDDRIAAVFGGGTVGQGNRRYDTYDGLALPTVGFGRANPNAIIKKTK